ncbi:MAG TPA: hypothetical protein VG407_12130 [Caulobacteraceae bacterium]|jgi:hypothetical protein|nr:hypothetical protein [Caulobacteraceae bacterium]
MTHPDRSPADLRLAQVFALDVPPPRDPAFTLQVMARVAQRKLAFDVARGAVATAFAALFLWALWPVLSKAFDPIAVQAWRAMGPAAAALVVVASILALERVSGRFGYAR